MGLLAERHAAELASEMIALFDLPAELACHQRSLAGGAFFVFNFFDVVVNVFFFFFILFFFFFLFILFSGFFAT